MTDDAFVLLTQRAQRLRGWVDLHAHPMTHLAFSGKLIHGAPDVDMLLPTDHQCVSGLRARSLAHALGPDNSTHGGWGVDNGCGDYLRAAVIDTLQHENDAYVSPDWAMGAPTFHNWPRWNDITHQKMWIDWIRRAHWGGLRVMVALATHNQTLAAAVAGPGDGPVDDRSAADLQIREIKRLVRNNDDVMKIAHNAAELRRIVGTGKLAIVLGVEIDAIGGYHHGTSPTLEMYRAELRRLHAAGVRYIFPVHLVDNPLGGTAVYQPAFNISNYREAGHFWQLECADPTDGITFAADGLPESGFAQQMLQLVKLGIDPGASPPPLPSCRQSGVGYRNRRSLSDLGAHVLSETMSMGMLIDIDHMSQHAVEAALDIVEQVDDGYPLNSGHNGRRVDSPTENSRTDEQLRRISRLGGLLGLGSDGVPADIFAARYRAARRVMGGRGVGLGTDLNGLVKGPPPPSGTVIDYARFPQQTTGARPWDYNADGVAHYGLLADFLEHVRGLPGGDEVVEGLYSSAEDFAVMWERCEAHRDRVAGSARQAASAP